MYKMLTDPEVSNNFVFTRTPFSEETLVDFIRNSWHDKRNVHFAVADEDDEYMGTVSLKNIDLIDRHAEYAIVIGRPHWGSGVAYEATDAIIDYGFNRLNLHKIYLNVLSSNIRANRFYEKYGFVREGAFAAHMFIDGKYEDLNWYCVFNR